MPTNTTTYLTRSQGTATSDKIGTFSAWIKSPQEGETNSIFTGYTDNNNKIYSYIGGGGLSIYGATGGSQSLYFVSNRKLRDVNGWYHIVITWDTTQSTESNRIKIYVNNVQETSFSTASYPSQNADIYWNKGTTSLIGARYVSSIVNFYYGSMSHIHFTDGTAYTPSAFGETDTTTGEWIGKTSPSVTYGNNGFFILKDGNGITDQSGEGNDFTLGGGTLTNLKDNPDNVFATLNPLGLNADVTFANGNNNATYGTSGTRSIVTGTLGANSGKYYWECEIQGNADANNAVLGVSMSGWETGYAVAGETNQSWGFRGFDGAVHNNNSSVGGTWATFTNGDIIGVAINLDDEQGGLNKLYFSKNGTWLNGADPSTPSSTTGVIGITKPENGDSGFYFPVVSDAGSTATPKFKMNFGNGYFGTVAVSSAGTNASENGIFEYDVPTGYTALSTKGLNL